MTSLGNCGNQVLKNRGKGVCFYHLLNYYFHY